MVVNIAIMRRLVSRINPMPLIAESAFGGVGVVVCPGCSETDAVVIFGFEDLIKDGLGGRS